MVKKWVVRVVFDDTTDKTFNSPFLECLRYARVVTVHRDGCFDIHAPDIVNDTKQWAEMNAERMRSFAFNAVAAPEWRTGEVL